MPEELVGQNQLRKKAIVIEEMTDKDYKWSVVVDFFKDKCDILKGFKIWDEVKVWLNFRAKEYNGKWFNSISWWSINSESSNTVQVVPPQNSYQDDLPFK
jgi:hypothetical protein